MSMIQLYVGEVCKEIQFEVKPKRRYALTNRGRILSFSETFDDGYFIKEKLVQGYPTMVYTKYINGNKKKYSFYIHKLLAQLFIPKPSEEHTYVLHKDWNRSNNDVRNLTWATYTEMVYHRQFSPKSIISREANRKLIKNRKLTETQVIRIKKMLIRNNTRAKMIAKQFGVSEMQISRIKSGENWGHVTL